MTVSSAVAKSGPYTGADDFVFAYNFRVFADAELQVTTVVIATGVEEILTLTTDYTVQDAGDPTGTVTLTAGTFPTGLPSTKKLVVSRDMGFLQEIDFENQGGFFPDTHEDGFDRLKMEVLQVKEEVDRSVKVDITGTTTPDDLLGEIDVSVAAAAASAAAAETAETNAETAETNAETAQTAAEAAQTAAEAAQAAAEAVDAYTKAELDAGQLDNRYYTETELDAGQLDTRYYTETELDAGQLDTRYYTETEADANYQPINRSPWNEAYAGTPGSVNEIEVTGLPSWVTEIKILGQLISSNTNGAELQFEVGHAGGYVTTGYAHSWSYGATDGAGPTDKGFLNLYGGMATEAHTQATLTLGYDFYWTWTAVAATGGSDAVCLDQGSVDATAVVTKLRVYWDSSATYDNGNLVILYR